MLKIVLGILAGYVVMALAVFCLFSVVYLAMGADRAYLPGTFDTSPLWLVTSVVVNFLAAFAGGRVTGMIGGARAARILAGIVLVLGLLMAVPALRSADTLPIPRTGDIGIMESMTRARTPGWAALSFPIIGAVGVFLGGTRRRS